MDNKACEDLKERKIHTLSLKTRSLIHGDKTPPTRRDQERHRHMWYEGSENVRVADKGLGKDQNNWNKSDTKKRVRTERMEERNTVCVCAGKWWWTVWWEVGWHCTLFSDPEVLQDAALPPPIPHLYGTGGSVKVTQPSRRRARNETWSPGSPLLLGTRLVVTLQRLMWSLQLLEVPTTKSSIVVIYKPLLAGVNVSSFLSGLQFSPQSRSLPSVYHFPLGCSPLLLPSTSFFFPLWWHRPEGEKLCRAPNSPLASVSLLAPWRHLYPGNSTCSPVPPLLSQSSESFL